MPMDSLWKVESCEDFNFFQVQSPSYLHAVHPVMTYYKVVESAFIISELHYIMMYISSENF